MDKNENFEYLIETTTKNIDAGTYASYYAFYLHGYNFANQIDLIYDSFEEREIFLATKDLCSDKCKHYLSDNGNYSLEPCGSCTRFYADMFENKED